MKTMDMPPKDPLQYENITYLWVIGLSIWGGMAGYINKIKKGHRSFSLTEMLGEMLISGFVGIMTFYLCESAKLNPLLSAAFIGISGHMGSRAIFMIEHFFESRLRKWFPNNGSDTD